MFGRNQRWGNECDRVITQLCREQRIRYVKDKTPAGGGHAMEGWRWVGEEDEDEI